MGAWLRRRFNEDGYSMVWYAVVFAFVLLPLMSLAVDITRLLYVRNDLQTSVDAACESASLAADTAYFNLTGEQRIHPGLAASYASQAFRASAIEAGLMLYSPALTAVAVLSPTQVGCVAHASVKAFIRVTPALNVQVRAQAKMRFVEQEP
jgi:Flp pilus assembly protein TadG